MNCARRVAWSFGSGLDLVSTTHASHSFEVIAAALCVIGATFLTDPLWAARQAETARQEVQGAVEGAVVPVTNPVSSAAFYRIKRRCEAALSEGARKLVFVIQPGTSDYGNCLNLAHFIESIQGATTIAYVPKTLTGHPVMVALAADELVMAQSAELGDIGAGETFIGLGMRSEYDELAGRRHRPYQAIIRGMLLKELQVYKVVTARDTRYVLDEELAQLDRTEQVKSKEVLIEGGQLGKFTGDELRKIGLVKRTAESLAELVEVYNLPREAGLDQVQLDELRAVQIRIEGVITPIVKGYVRRHINESQARGRNFFIFQINSPGGLAHSGMELAEFIRDRRGVKTVAYIRGEAISAAAFVALGCDEVVMHPTAKLGDCGVMFVKGGQFQYVPEKQLSIFRTALRGLARDNLYSPALAEAMIDKDMVVKEVHDPKSGRTLYLREEDIQEQGLDAHVRRTVKDKGEFLTMTGEEAKSLGFASELVNSDEELLAIYGLEGPEVAQVNPNWVDNLIEVLSSKPMAVVLLVVGLFGLFLELKLPGIGLPIIVAGLCFMLFFWSRMMGGTAGWLEVILFLLGVVCLGIEILVLPGFGVFGLSGILLVMSSVVLASQTFPPSSGDLFWKDLAANLGTLSISLVLLFGLAYWVGKYLPEVPILGRLVLSPQAAGGGAEGFMAYEPSALDDLVGAEGVAITALRPAGRVEFGDRFVDVVAEGSFLEEGTRVRVAEISGNRVVVKAV